MRIEFSENALGKRRHTGGESHFRSGRSRDDSLSARAPSSQLGPPELLGSSTTSISMGRTNMYLNHGLEGEGGLCHIGGRILPVKGPLYLL